MEERLEIDRRRRKRRAELVHRAVFDAWLEDTEAGQRYLRELKKPGRSGATVHMKLSNTGVKVWVERESKRRAGVAK
jgi:hypothetical protein